METKLCKKCNIEKPLTEMKPFKTKKSAGFRGVCKLCYNNYHAKSKYYLKRLRPLTDNEKEYHKNYRKNNKKSIAIKDKIRKSTQEFKNKNNNLLKIRRETDHLFRVKSSIRSLIIISFKRKNFNKPNRTKEILGCSYNEFKEYLESKFESWMNWDNYGNPKDGVFELNKTWDIDHIIPLSTAKTIDDLIRLNHHTNLQPLCTYTNRFIKNNKIYG